LLLCYKVVYSISTPPPSFLCITTTRFFGSLVPSSCSCVVIQYTGQVWFCVRICLLVVLIIYSRLAIVIVVLAMIADSKPITTLNIMYSTAICGCSYIHICNGMA
jgi:hypothetical protein